MPQVDDFRLRNGVWEGYNSNNQWNALPNSMQEYLNSNFSGVSGTGSNQLFLPLDRGPDATRPSQRRETVITALMGISQPTGSTGAGSSPRSIQSLWQEFMPDVPWPPVDKILGEIDTNLINSFLSSLRANNVAGWSEPKRFTIVDANGKTHVFGQAPGSTKVIDLGIVGEDAEASASFVTGDDSPDGRTYIRQPDGKLELVPGQTTTRGEGKYEYDRNLGRWVIRQPDGSIQFGPEATQDAKIEVDSDGRRYITQPDGSIQYLGREFEPGVISQGGYNLLQQPSGALSQLAPLPEPADVETIGGMQFIRTSTGELMPLDNVMNRMMENMVVTGDLEGAAAIHAWQTRPSNQEYFDRALAYMRSPADQLVISAIARGQGLVSPPPEETIQRIGPQPDYLTEAFNMLQDQMQMGMPEGTQTFANTLAERAQAIELEAAELALERQREENNQLAISNSLNNEAAAIANEGASIANQTAVITTNDNHTSAVLNQDAADINNSIAASALTGDDSDDGDDQDDVLVSDEKDPDTVVAETAPDPATAPTYAPSEEDTYVAPEVEQLSFQEAVAQIQEESPGSTIVFSQPDSEPMPAPTYAPPEEADPIMPAPTYAPPEEAAPITTAEALASFGVAPSQMSSYAGTTPASTPASTSASTDPFGGGRGRMFGRAGGGMVGKREMTMVGESGPELALFPHGTEIIPLDRQMQPSQVQRLRNRGIRGMQEGGIVFDSPLPLGIRQLQAGRSLGAPRGQLLRTAGIALPSAQARRRMLPGEREAFGELGRLAGIPEAEFQQELAITDPSGAPRTTNARMLPLSLRR